MQITIYLPDDVGERVKAHRAELAVSRICAQALDQEIDKLTLMKQGVIEFPPELIARLKEEKQQFDRYCFDLGRRDADEWLRTAHYTMIKALGEVGAGDDNFYADFHLPHDADIIYGDTLAEERTDEEPYFVTWSAAGYKRGWHERVIQFWLKVKNQL